MVARVRAATVAWYAAFAVAVAVAAGASEIALAGHRAIAFVRWLARAHDPADEVARWFIGMSLAAPCFALLALGWFTLFAARAARRGTDDGYLGMAAGLALSL